MEDLSYIIGLGFSGTDVWRAVIISFFAAMIVRRKQNLLRITFWALIFDRCIWPLSDMAFSGASGTSIMASFTALIENFTMDLGLYVVRLAGLYLLINIFFMIRQRIHKPSMDRAKAKRAKPAYS